MSIDTTVRDQDAELRREHASTKRLLDAAADTLLDLSAQTGWSKDDPYLDAVRWLTDAAHRAGVSVERFTATDALPPTGLRKATHWPSPVVGADRHEARRVGQRWGEAQDDVESVLRAAIQVVRDALGEPTFLTGEGARLLHLYLDGLLPARLLPVAEPAEDPPVAEPPTVTINRRHQQVHEIADRQGSWKCFYCGVGMIDVCLDDDVILDDNGGRLVNPASTKALPTRDHLIPRALGGSDDVRNLVLACQPCNSRKGAS